MTPKKNQFDLAREIIEASQEHGYTREGILTLNDNDILKSIDFMLNEAVHSHGFTLQKNHVIVRSQIGRYLRPGA